MIFFTGLHTGGPDLSPASLADGLFRLPPAFTRAYSVTTYDEPPPSDLPPPQLKRATLARD